MNGADQRAVQRRLHLRQRLGVEHRKLHAKAVATVLGLLDALLQLGLGAIQLEPTLLAYQRFSAGGFNHRRMGIQRQLNQRGPLFDNGLVAAAPGVVPVLEQRHGGLEHSLDAVANIDLAIRQDPQHGAQIARKGVRLHRLALYDAGVAK